MSRHDAWRIDENGFPRGGSPAEQLRFLVRYAVLAPSSHNTQPWRFRLRGETLELHADPTRWLRVADADRRELHLSVGCALENLLVAAERFGVGVEVAYFPEGEASELAARIVPARGAAPGLQRPRALFQAIAARHTNHRTYDGRPLAPEHWRGLQEIAVEPGIEAHITDDTGVHRSVDELVVRADALQFADPAWRQELAYWLGQGVFGTGWVTSKLAQLAVGYLDLAKGTARKDTERLDSASALGLVSVERPSRTAQVQAGQAFERLFLQATALGVRLQPMNQVLQVPEIKRELAALVPARWDEPQITFRLGYAEPEGHTPRRPLSEVLD